MPCFYSGIQTTSSNDPGIHSHFGVFWQDTDQPVLLGRGLLQPWTWNTAAHLGLNDPLADSSGLTREDELTHLHQGPVVVHLLAGLEEVPAVGPHGGVLLCDDRCAYKISLDMSENTLGL